MTRAVVVGAGPRAGRTLRALARRGLRPTAAADLASALDGPGPVWAVAAGCWTPRLGPPPAPSATGRPLVALGALLGDPAWSTLLARTGGHLERIDSWPAPHSLYLEPPATTALACRLARGEAVETALSAVVRDLEARGLRVRALDVRHDAGLRVAQVVTSLQQGGAERIALDLHRGLPGHGIASLLVALGRPLRRRLPGSDDAVDLSAVPGGRAGRLEVLLDVLAAEGVDAVEAHLLDRPDLAALAAAGHRVASVVHNTREGWPAGLDEVQANEAVLLVACCRAVEDGLAALPVPARTVWNGIDAGACAPTAASAERGRALRAALGIGAGDLLLAAVANPRPQKRLHLLPAVLAALGPELARHGDRRVVRLAIAGGTGTPAAAEAEARLRAEGERCGVGPRLHLAGSLDDVPALLAAADALLAPSAHEGLSLAQLEALAAGCPVLATAVGGAPELARLEPRLRLLPVEAEAPDWAAAVADALAAPPAREPSAAVGRHFSRERMVEGHARLLRRIAAPPGTADGVLLVANNFSTGGAQSSARRLLLGLHQRGVSVRACVLQEDPAWPTPGRRALLGAGVAVEALPPDLDAAAAVERILAGVDGNPPRAVLLWNVIPEHKWLLADALLAVPVFDVSPGEMYFASLDRFLERPRAGLACRDARDYGMRLRGVVVKYAAEAARAAALGAPVHVIPNGVPVGPLPRRSAAARLTICTAARLAPHKRLGDLLDALRRALPRLPPCVLRIAGGEERGSEGHAAELREQARGLPVEWLGEIPDASEVLRTADLFVQVSEPAGCPNASLEAMAAGLPVVATDVGGAAEQLEHAVTGLLAPARDAAALAESLVEASSDRDRLLAWGRAGHARARDRFEVSRMVGDYERLLGVPAGAGA